VLVFKHYLLIAYSARSLIIRWGDKAAVVSNTTSSTILCVSCQCEQFIFILAIYVSIICKSINNNIAVYYSVLQYLAASYNIFQCMTVLYKYSILQYITLSIAVYYSVLQCIVVYYSVLQYIEM